MDFTEIRFLGGKLGTAIAADFDVKTVGDLLSVPLEDLQKRFGEEAVWVYNVIRVSRSTSPRASVPHAH
jgi:DNA polymerase eta